MTVTELGDVSNTRQRATSRSQQLIPWVQRIVFYLVLLAAWEGIARSGIWPAYVLPGPLDVFQSLSSGLRKGLFIPAALVSLQRIALGYAVSMVIGVPLGMLIARNKLAETTLGSLVLGLQALPSICWLPLAVLWFGLSETSIIFIVIMGALFSIAIGVETGIKNTPPLYVKAARTLGARGPAVYTQVVLPAALPAIIGGLKQGWSFAWRSLMAGELLFFTLSLGNLLQAGRDLNDVARVMAVMLVIIMIGIAIDRLIFAPLERRVRERWGLNG